MVFGGPCESNSQVLHNLRRTAQNNCQNSSQLRRTRSFGLAWPSILARSVPASSRYEVPESNVVVHAGVKKNRMLGPSAKIWAMNSNFRWSKNYPKLRNRISSLLPPVGTVVAVSKTPVGQTSGDLGSPAVGCKRATLPTKRRAEYWKIRASLSRPWIGRAGAKTCEKRSCLKKWTPLDRNNAYAPCISYIRIHETIKMVFSIVLQRGPFYSIIFYPNYQDNLLIPKILALAPWWIGLLNLRPGPSKVLRWTQSTPSL